MRDARPLNTAWLISREWIGDHVHVDQPVVATLDSRRSGEHVRQFAERLYCSTKFGIEEKVRVAGDAIANPYPAKVMQVKGASCHGVITCGHSPYLLARLVRNVRVFVDSEGSERLEFEKVPKVIPRETT